MLLCLVETSWNNDRTGTYIISQSHAVFVLPKLLLELPGAALLASGNALGKRYAAKQHVQQYQATRLVL